MSADRGVILRYFTCSHLQYRQPEDEDITSSHRDLERGEAVETQEIVRGFEGLPRRIYVLGVGNVGTFVAHALAGIPNPPPITLLLRRWERFRDYRAKGSALRLTTHDMTEVRRGFKVEVASRNRIDPSQSGPLPLKDYDDINEGRSRITTRDSSSGFAPLLSQHQPLDAFIEDPQTSNINTDVPPSRSEDNQAASNRNDLDFYSPNPDTNPIRSDQRQDADANVINEDLEKIQVGHNTQAVREREGVIAHLIVTVKAQHTVNAISEYAHRLTPDSTILFLQNGLGMIDEVNRAIFPNEEDRPHYMIGVLSHGLWSKDPFDIIHTGNGTIALGLSAEKQQYPASARYLLRTMTRTPVFVAVGFNPTEIFQQQLDKLAVNAVVNPLTAIFDCLNGQLLDNFYITRVMRLLIAEISIVFRSLPELRNVPNVNMRFGPARLESMVVSIAKSTAQNRSSMLQDVRGGRQTEIDYINGYVIKRGEELGIHCVTNYMVMHMVKAKDKMTEQEGGVLPLRPSIASRK